MMTGVDALNREREEERERERRRRPRELLVRDLALLSFRAPRSEDQEPREDNTRGRDSEVSLDSPRRRACGEEWGETTEAEAQEGGVCCERAAPTSPAPEGEGEAGVRPLAPDDCPEALPPLSLDLGRTGGEGAPLDTTPGAT